MAGSLRNESQPSPGDLRHDKAFFGREEELYQLVKNLQRGRHTLIVGEKGIGKTRIMEEARRVLSGRAKRIDLSAAVMTHSRGKPGIRISRDQYRTLLIEHPSPLADCLKETAEQLHDNGDLPLEADGERTDWVAVKQRLAGLGSIKLQELIFEGLARSDKPYLVFIDNLDRISPSQQSFIETLLNVAVICTTAVQMKESVFFRRIWASFTKIYLAEMSAELSSQLIGYYSEHYPLHVIDGELYRNEILKSSNGNPFHMKNLLWHGSREKFIDTQEIRTLRQADVGEYFNMGPMYIFGVAMFTMFKIFSIGADNREFYIYFSALGFVAYLVFRVFRAFFIFRPQRHG